MAPDAERPLAADFRAQLRELLPNPVLLALLAAIALISLAVVIGDANSWRALVSDLLRTIGIGALAAAVTVFIDHNLLFRTFENRIRDSLLAASGTSVALRQLGIQNAYNPFSFSTIFIEAKTGDTVSWLDTYCPIHNDFLFLTALAGAVKRNVTVRMLIIDPSCANAISRSAELKLSTTRDTGEAFTAALNAFKEKMGSIAKDSQGRMEVRYYSDLPCIPMYLIGKPGHSRKAFFSIFLSEATAHCTHVEISNGEWLTNMTNYFDAKWADWNPKTHGAGRPVGRT